MRYADKHFTAWVDCSLCFAKDILRNGAGGCGESIFKQKALTGETKSGDPKAPLRPQKLPRGMAFFTMRFRFLVSAEFGKKQREKQREIGAEARFYAQYGFAFSMDAKAFDFIFLKPSVFH